MRHGAVDFLTKPVQPGELEETLRRLLEPVRPVGDEPPSDPFRELIGEHPSVKQLCETLRMVAASPATILLEGESGTGKRVVAHAIHQADSKRRAQPFVEVSCGALPETLLESELFGHVRGAFTGAVRDKQGRFELASGGTILLDEIDTFSPHLQVKLLKVLQERTFERVGDGHSLKAEVRVIAATNRHLHELVRQGTFREDLYYRLNVIALRLPPLRERASDIPLLANHFLRQACAESGKVIAGIREETMRLLTAYPWPGNVRELENTIQRAVILAQRRLIMPQDLPENHRALARRDDESSAASKTSTGSLKEAIRAPERDIILQALAQAQGNRSLAAKRLRIHRATLYRKLRQLARETESVPR
jgi:DNA-binding NtrC family response regulator